MGHVFGQGFVCLALLLAKGTGCVSAGLGKVTFKMVYTFLKVFSP